MIDDILQRISDAIVKGEDEQAEKLVNQSLDAGLSPLEILNNGVVDGIAKTGELWKKNEYFLPDVILAADAFKSAMTPLEPVLKQRRLNQHGRKFVIGVVEGDMHDLGKNLVIAMLTSAGFEVIDLGINVPIMRFVEAVKEHRPDIIGMGAYMTTTMLQMKEIIIEIEKQDLRGGLQIMVGGVPTSQEFADEVGADAWGKDALDCMQKAMALVGV